MMGLQRCCCYNLRDGSHAIGITLLVLTSLGLVSSTGVLSFINNRGINNEHYSLTAAFVIQILFELAYLVFNILLVRGVETSSHPMILAWLIFHGVSSCIISIGFLATFICTFVYGLPAFLGATVLLGAVVSVMWYFFAIVIAYYQKTSNGFVYKQQVDLLENM